MDFTINWVLFKRQISDCSNYCKIGKIIWWIWFFFHVVKVYPAQTTLSPEVTSKAAPNEEEVTDVKTLTDKLAAAFLKISAKEDLVKQHAKVAEEAVSGIYCLALSMQVTGSSATSNVYYHKGMWDSFKS